ncbi:hypothetical protein LAUMK13_04392 [Mycobacterium innocens]|uniref:Uncharacterized protein n=1 Tax=Mycobacterium innocens TaxID=2341083 RepID=A0A498QF00_9MYCO|nr:hypothetical protein LAUMK13_04392 [Mycobacterium innocens]
MTASDKSLASCASLSGTARGYNGTQVLAIRTTANDCPRAVGRQPVATLRPPCWNHCAAVPAPSHLYQLPHRSLHGWTPERPEDASRTLCRLVHHVRHGVRRSVRRSNAFRGHNAAGHRCPRTQLGCPRTPCRSVFGTPMPAALLKPLVMAGVRRGRRRLACSPGRLSCPPYRVCGDGFERAYRARTPRLARPDGTLGAPTAHSAPSAHTRRRQRQRTPQIDATVSDEPARPDDR